MAEANDAAAVVRIYVDSWNLGFAGLMPERRFDPELVVRWEKDIGAAALHIWWIAELTGRIV